MLDTCEDLPRAVAEGGGAARDGRPLRRRRDAAARAAPRRRRARATSATRVYLLLLRHAERVDRSFVTLPAGSARGSSASCAAWARG
jgi:hypothetical protein